MKQRFCIEGETQKEGSERGDEESGNLLEWCLGDGVPTKLLTKSGIVDVVGVDEQQLDGAMRCPPPSVRFAASQHGEIDG